MRHHIFTDPRRVIATALAAMLGLAVGLAGCKDTPSPPQPSDAPLAVAGWAADFAADPEPILALLEDEPSWLLLARARAFDAMLSFAERLSTAPSPAVRLGLARACEAVADALAPLGSATLVMARTVAAHDTQSGASASALLAGRVAGDASDPARTLRAALFAGEPRAVGAAESCVDEGRPADVRLIACALAGRTEPGLAAGRALDWRAHAHSDRRPAGLLVDPAPILALERLYRRRAADLACAVDLPGARALCVRAGGSPTARPESAAAAGDVLPALVFSSRSGGPVGAAPAHTVARDLRLRRDRHRAWMATVDPERADALRALGAVDAALCADLHREVAHRLTVDDPASALALLNLFPRSTCVEGGGPRRSMTARRAALEFAAAVAVGDPQVAFAAADSRLAGLDEGPAIQRGPWLLAAAAARTWGFSGTLHHSNPVPE